MKMQTSHDRTAVPLEGVSVFAHVRDGPGPHRHGADIRRWTARLIKSLGGSVALSAAGADIVVFSGGGAAVLESMQRHKGSVVVGTDYLEACRAQGRKLDPQSFALPLVKTSSASPHTVVEEEGEEEEADCTQIITPAIPLVKRTRTEALPSAAAVVASGSESSKRHEKEEEEALIRHRVLRASVKQHIEKNGEAEKTDGTMPCDPFMHTDESRCPSNTPEVTVLVPPPLDTAGESVTPSLPSQVGPQAHNQCRSDAMTPERGEKKHISFDRQSLKREEEEEAAKKEKKNKKGSVLKTPAKPAGRKPRTKMTVVVHVNSVDSGEVKTAAVSPKKESTPETKEKGRRKKAPAVALPRKAKPTAAKKSAPERSPSARQTKPAVAAVKDVEEMHFSDSALLRLSPHAQRPDSSYQYRVALYVHSSQRAFLADVVTQLGGRVCGGGESGDETDALFAAHKNRPTHWVVAVGMPLSPSVLLGKALGAPLLTPQWLHDAVLLGGFPVVVPALHAHPLFGQEEAEAEAAVPEGGGGAGETDSRVLKRRWAAGWHGGGRAQTSLQLETLDEVLPAGQCWARPHYRPLLWSLTLAIADDVDSHRGRGEEEVLPASYVAELVRTLGGTVARRRDSGCVDAVLSLAGNGGSSSSGNNDKEKKGSGAAKVAAKGEGNGNSEEDSLSLAYRLAVQSYQAFSQSLGVSVSVNSHATPTVVEEEVRGGNEEADVVEGEGEITPPVLSIQWLLFTIMSRRLAEKDPFLLPSTTTTTTANRTRATRKETKGRGRKQSTAKTATRKTPALAPSPLPLSSPPSSATTTAVVKSSSSPSFKNGSKNVGDEVMVTPTNVDTLTSSSSSSSRRSLSPTISTVPVWSTAKDNHNDGAIEDRETAEEASGSVFTPSTAVLLSRKSAKGPSSAIKRSQEQLNTQQIQSVLQLQEMQQQTQLFLRNASQGALYRNSNRRNYPPPPPQQQQQQQHDSNKDNSGSGCGAPLELIGDSISQGCDFTAATPSPTPESVLVPFPAAVSAHSVERRAVEMLAEGAYGSVTPLEGPDEGSATQDSLISVGDDDEVIQY